MTVDEVMKAAPVIPVLVLDGEHDPVALAETLVEAGLPVLELTLRTPQALDSIRAMAGVPGAIVGAGTVLNERQLGEAEEAGARFIVAPGLTEPLTRAAQASGIAYLPGIATAGDIMRGLDLGLDRFKFFPAEASGGLPAVRSLAAPFGSVRFCPTGGITEASAREWLAEPAVTCIGGSWMVKKGMSLAAIGEAARRASALRPA
ncbi:bifunctional 4-hydroxy-2-oxoglutarate aldolase/2-dehydro-3-deoxy-phosphogluconate aldolase [Sphingomonas sp. LHG3406-1]|uniref:bifunctional 4-hydroxy-2-oxoglutarate aldolase/2-dehydro-3-deoxy-phosphogluconate aldolase n=1 Tax=Sphingomonas sp. LHG3406-1 TaxID=2804617 RepID=UPI002613B8C3|nr:bifunctional 4-hydroxy-2-oxoglutarate aldolase/2-dehydro-3-deoxy-phosphogluconate aldolase [Sphingomonas sp. LHG3406-1]